jgi:hypothetical protein
MADVKFYPATAADFVGFSDTPVLLDPATNHGEITESFDVPASLVYQGPIPLEGTEVTITVDGDARTVVPDLAPSSGQVRYRRSTGLITFHSSDSGDEAEITMTPFVTPANGALLGVAIGNSPAVSLPLAIAQGGTGSTSASAARTALGLGSMSTQNSAAVSITGGSATFTDSSGIQVSFPNVASANSQVGQLTSTDYGLGITSNNIVLRALNNNPGANIRFEVLDTNKHFGFNRGGTLSSHVTILWDPNHEGSILLRSNNAVNSIVPSQYVAINQASENTQYINYNDLGNHTFYINGTSGVTALRLTPTKNITQTTIEAIENNQLYLKTNATTTGNAGGYVLVESGGTNDSGRLIIQNTTAQSGADAISGIGMQFAICGKGKFLPNGTSIITPTNFEFGRLTMRPITESGDLVIDTLSSGTGTQRNIVIAPQTGVLKLRAAITEARHEVVTVTGNTTLTQAQSNAQVLVTTGTAVVTLPTAPLAGTTYTITWASATVTGSVARGGASDTIIGAGYASRTSITPVAQGSVTLRYAGSNWRIISMQGVWL